MPPAIAPPTAWYCTASASHALGACLPDVDRCERFRDRLRAGVPDLSRCESQRSAWCFDVNGEPHCAPAPEVCEALRSAASRAPGGTTGACEAVEAAPVAPAIERCRSWHLYLELAFGYGESVDGAGSTQTRLRQALGAVHDDCPPDRTSGSQLRFGSFVEIGASSLHDGAAPNSALGAEGEIDWVLGETGMHAGPRLAAGGRLSSHSPGAVISLGPRLRAETLAVGVDAVYRSGPGPDAMVVGTVAISPRTNAGNIELVFGEGVCTLVFLALASIGPRS